jgi:uncharacterized C2H2 Zn-finger protein
MIGSRCLCCGYRGEFAVIDERTKVLTIFQNGELIEGVAGALMAECPRCEFTFLLNPLAQIRPDKVIYKKPDIVELRRPSHSFVLRNGTTFACVQCGAVFKYGSTGCEDLCKHLRGREPVEWLFLGLVAPVCTAPWGPRED